MEKGTRRAGGRWGHFLVPWCPASCYKACGEGWASSWGLFYENPKPITKSLLPRPTHFQEARLLIPAHQGLGLFFFFSFSPRTLLNSISPFCSTTFCHFSLVVVWSLSRVWLFCDPTVCSPPGSFVHVVSRQEDWGGLPFPSPGGLGLDIWILGRHQCSICGIDLRHQLIHQSPSDGEREPMCVDVIYILYILSIL